MIHVAFNQGGWSKVIQGVEIPSLSACGITNWSVEYIQVSSDGFISMIGRNLMDAFW